MPRSTPPHIHLVIPCFHESRRLPPFLEALVPALQGLPLNVTIRVADDGSGEAELEQLRPVVNALREVYPAVLLPLLERPHEGKGGTILGGWRAAPEETTHFAFADADGAVSADEIRRVFGEFFASPDTDPATCLFAIRKKTPSTTIKREPSRRVIGLLYYRLVRFIMDADIYDPACGFKMVSRAFWERCGELLEEKEWALDIELLARIQFHGFPLRQIPVSWEEKSGSKIVRADIVRILKQVIAIKQRSNDWKAES